MLGNFAELTLALSIDCSYGHTGEIGHLTTDVYRGEIVVLTGENGAGKSTLTETLAGELEPIHGAVRVAVSSEDTSLLDPASPEATGCVTRIADPAFLPDLTLGEHFDLIARRSRMDINDLLDRVIPWKLEELPDTLPGRLSSGQRQRANLGIQLAIASPVVILDEPERHLDADWTRVLSNQLRVLAQKGSTVVVASHSPVIIDASDREIRLQVVM